MFEPDEAVSFAKKTDIGVVTVKGTVIDHDRPPYVWVHLPDGSSVNVHESLLSRVT